MKLIVNPHKIEIEKSPVNEREINISKCEFVFSDEITNEYTKEAYFTFEGTTYKQIIVNNECDFPSEVLVKKGTVEIGVVAFLVEDETEIKRYNPSPAYFDTWQGSLKDNAENSEPITPSEMEQFEQALNDGLNEVNDKLDEIDQAIDDVNEAIIETNNLDLDVDKQGKVATVTLTKKDASTKIVTLSDGTSLMFNWDGTKLGIKTDEDAEYTYVDLQGVQGPIGPKGEAFTIKKTYTSVAEMNADFNNMQVGDYVMIASTVEVEDNAKLYTRGETQWIFISDFSGATGIRGETGLTPNIQIGTVISGTIPNVTRTGTNENPILNFTLVKGDTGTTGPQGETGATGNGILSIQKTATQGLVDTYTITFTDGTTTTFDVTNGEDGEVTQAQLDETNENVEWLQILVNQLPTVDGTGTDISLQDVLNYRLMKFLPQGSSSQESTTGKNILNMNNFENNGTDRTTFTADENSITITTTSSGTYRYVLNTINNLTIGETYTFSFGAYQDGSNGLAQFGIVNSQGQYYNYSKYLAETQQMTFTPTETSVTVRIGYLSSNVGQNISLKVNNIQLEKNSSNTSYEPYTGGQPAPSPSYPFPIKVATGENSLIISNSDNTQSQTYPLSFGTMELCSTPDGTIRDQIVGSPNNWVKREYMKKIVLTGQEVFNAHTTTETYLRLYATGTEFKNLVNGGLSYCNYFSNDNTPGAISVINAFRIALAGSGANIRTQFWICLDINEFEDLTAFTNWLTTKYNNNTPVIVYAPLETPVDVPITDTTLINQLNNIYNNAYSYNGTTNITSTFEDGNEQMVIDASALMDLNSLVTRIETIESEV